MYSIEPLVCGHWVDAGPRIFYLGDLEAAVDIADIFWLVRGEGRTILVDVGVDSSDGQRILPSLKQAPAERPDKLLAVRGVKPEGVTDVVLTHLHWDHASPMLDRYTKARIYVQKRELDAVLRSRHAWFARFTFPETVAKLEGQWRDRVHAVDGEEEVLPGLTCLWTGGHTPGHQSVIVETGKGRVAIAGDVVFTLRSWDEKIPCGFNSSLEQCFDAFDTLAKRAEVVLPGHDEGVVERYGARIG